MNHLSKSYYRNILYSLLVLFLISNQIFAQTQPNPKVLPYSQAFDSFDGSFSVQIPDGMQGWTVSTGAPTVEGRTDAPIADRGLFAGGTAASNNAGIYDFNGKIGISCNATNTLAIALSINTLNLQTTERVRVKFDGMVIRNVAVNATNNIINALILQYRIGTTGSFKNIAVSAQNGKTLQNTGTNGVDLVNTDVLLPVECSREPVVQLRWTVKTINGSIGEYPSFAIDNIQIAADASSPPPIFTGYKITSRNIKLADRNVTYATNMLDGVTRIQKTDQYGGAQTDFIGNSKGYFTTYKDDRDVWYLIDPDGYKFYSIGINTIVPQKNGANPVNLIKSIYANTIGNFSDESYTSMPYCVRLNFALTYRTSTIQNKTLYDAGVLTVFDPEFDTYCNNQAKSQITAERITDKNLLGYFSDNEMPLANPFNGKLIDRWLDVNNYGGAAQASVNPNYIAAINWMKARHGGNLVNPTSADDAEFPGFVADRYYKVCSEAIKARDPNHLYIGSRLHQDLANRYLFEAAGKYVDVLSVNNYNVWSVSQLSDRYNVWEQYTGKPFMVTEFYAQAEDSGLPNDTGAGFNVSTQQDRADFFEHYTMEMLKRKWNVGFQYFKLNDDPNKNNKGLINVNDEFWQPMKISFTKIAQDIYNLRKFLIFGEQTIDVPTSVRSDKKALSNFSMEIYPNPSFGNVNIQVNGFKEKTASINVYDFTGKLVHQEKLKTNNFNVTHRLNFNTELKQGIYILEFGGSGSFNRKKLIIQ